MGVVLECSVSYDEYKIHDVDEGRHAQTNTNTSIFKGPENSWMKIDAW